MKIILDVQRVYLHLQQLHSNYTVKPFSQERARAMDATGYPIEKIGVALDMLLNSRTPVEEANYEIGIAADHMRRTTPKVNDPAIRRELAELAGKLDAIFSSLPAKPWPMKGYGHPDVESRFDSDPVGD